MLNKQLISHNLNTDSFNDAYKAREKLIRQRGDLEDISVDEQIELLACLAEFQFGRYLIEHQGLNGYWTQYMVRHPKCRAAPGLDAYGRPLLPLERFLLEEAPIILATQQRGEIFQKLLQGKMTDHAQFASLPCGLMYDLASLKPALNFKAYGIDLDQAALDLAVKVAQAYSVDAELICEDAWQLSLTNTLDVLCSNGLTIYEPDDDRVQVFYQKCYQALKPNG